MLSKSFSLNSLPIAKAIKPSAVWLIISKEPTSLSVLKPTPDSPNRPMKKGPIRRPAIK